MTSSVTSPREGAGVRPTPKFFLLPEPVSEERVPQPFLEGGERPRQDKDRGGLIEDKPDVEMATPQDPNRVRACMNIRAADVQAV